MKKTNTNPFRPTDSNAMDVDDADNFLNGPDADDFGSEYESAADDIGVAPPTSTSQPDKSRPPPAYSVAQADAQEDMDLALAMSASLASPALGTGRGTTSNSKPWTTQKSPNGVSTASVQAAQREIELAWQTPRTNVSGPLADRDPPNYATIASTGGTRSSANTRKPMCVVSTRNTNRSIP